MAISCANATTHLDEINEEEGDDFEENPTGDEVVPETNFTHYQFTEKKKKMTTRSKKSFSKTMTPYSK